MYFLVYFIFCVNIIIEKKKKKKPFYNGKKVPIIPPLFINNRFVTDFQEKANVFNSFFAKQCSPIPISSVLPAKISYMTKGTVSRLSVLVKMML